MNLKRVEKEFAQVPMTVYGVHLLVLQPATVTHEHRERATEHCGLIFALRGEVSIRVNGARYRLTAGQAIHCSYGQYVEMNVGAEEFEGILVQYLPDEGPGLLAGLQYMSRSFSLQPGIDEGLFELLRTLCLISRQRMPDAAFRVKPLLERVLRACFHLCRRESKRSYGADVGRVGEDRLVHALADFFNRSAFLVEDVIRLAVRPGQTIAHGSLPKSGFLFAFEGEASIALDGTEYRLHPGEVCHGSEGERLVLTPCGEDRFEYVLIHYRVCYWPERDGEAFPRHFVLCPGERPRIAELVEQLHQIAVIPGKLTAFRKKELFMSVLYELLSASQHSSWGASHLEAIERTILYIHAHYAEPLSLDQLARLQGITVRQLSYWFYKIIGIRPIDYVIQYRINKASEMLTMSHTPIGEIAASVGYDDPQYFSRVYRRHTGLSPREARSKSHPARD
ncbi:helix-turn-helix domain-containing protein [Paenibacillus sp. 598K]|uniref:helix-turn-helix domain-containing protein n=1 Tax=Paenibacillus sp. 598K TaxID=1117987 RepID=UPI001627892C|nr:AraC family transcriptional regulator [Paenibacillus sp. 598K]